ncbi:CotY/CotZ family spore coat protein [Virgibacillus necropolis]|uniref:Spore coat protein n=1 Tax=Virgibacillus necropolis TaxID=163877 RepID=A0A221M9X4_9BACI|nr:CotY/CotZ family spore coat protein [Virgibacillus necropolis]ASN04421.1 spore coat protein [Virgibacillus necropolis]
MGCYKEGEMIKPKHSSDDCVCDVVRNIVKAQDQVADNICSSSCYRSIQQLRGKGNGLQNTTIPFILYCSGTCKPFIGSGVFQAPLDTNAETFFGCIETPIFRAKQFVENNDCCVKLELLLPISEGYQVKSYHMDNVSKVCSFFSEDDPVTDFMATGICLTVNLEHFLGITCLDPIIPK